MRPARAASTVSLLRISRITSSMLSSAIRKPARTCARSCALRSSYRVRRESVQDRKSTRLNSSHTVIYTLSLHDALPISDHFVDVVERDQEARKDVCTLLRLAQLIPGPARERARSEEHTSELQSHSDLHSFPTRRSSDLGSLRRCCRARSGSPQGRVHALAPCAAHTGSGARAC